MKVDVLVVLDANHGSAAPSSLERAIRRDTRNAKASIGPAKSEPGVPAKDRQLSSALCRYSINPYATGIMNQRSDLPMFSRETIQCFLRVQAP